MDELEQVRDLAEQAARAGGAVARLKREESDHYFSWKRSRDPFVETSLSVQDAIVATIRASYPEAAILCEEGPDDEVMPVDADPLWIVDPICGSLNYMHRDPSYAVAVGYRADGVWQVGAVYEAERDDLYSAIDGRGAFLNGHAIVVEQFADGVEAFQRAVVGVDWPGEPDARKEMLTIVGTLAPIVLTVRVMGSPALALCYVACGRLHGYSALDLRAWDIAPAAVVLQNAGGTLTNWSGSSWYHASDGGYVASNSVIHGRLLQSTGAVHALRRLAAQRAATQSQPSSS
ncbi:MAG TPA: inositol monophosphatase [Chloroflexota bacterium]|jgi:myo-inositol-1(or 4)-monophosphatase